LLAGLTTAILPLLIQLPLLVGLFCAGLLLWRFLHDMGRVPLPRKPVLFGLLLLVMLGVFQHFHTIIGRHAGSALLICLLCLKLLELRTLRDVSMAVQLAFFSILAGFLFNQSIPAAVLMFAAVILLLGALLTFHHARAGYHSTAAVEKGHIAHAARMVLYAVPLMLILFVLFPRLNTTLWSLPEDASQGQTGLSGTMSPGLVSRLSNSPEVAFRAQFDTAPPDKLLRYWRGPVLWFFDGFTWSAPDSAPLLITTPVLEQKRNKISYHITLQPHQSTWLFALDMPGAVPDGALMNDALQLLSPQPVSKLLKYRVDSYLHYVLPRQSDRPNITFLAVPRHIGPQTRRLVQQLQRQHPAPEAFINAVLDHFRENDYYYSRTPPLLFDDPIDEFLFQSKRGYCEHYASTFTIMLRLAGIPARVVTGYQGGEMNPLSNYMIVRQSDAHAWSEVYLNDKGWVRVDPTAVIPVNRIENPADAVRLRPGLIDVSRYVDREWYKKTLKQFRFAVDVINNHWNQWVVGYNEKRQRSFFDIIGILEFGWYGIGYLLVAALSLVTLLIGFRILTLQRGKSDPVRRIYRRFLKKTARRKLYQAPTEGALSFAARVAERFPAQRTALLTIAETYNDLRYGHPDQDALAELRQAINNLRLTP